MVTKIHTLKVSKKCNDKVLKYLKVIIESWVPPSIKIMGILHSLLCIAS